MKAGKAQQGFALAAVLWLLAGLTVVVASVSGITLTAAERVAQLRHRVDFMQSAYGTRAHLLYWLSGTGTDANSFTDDVKRVRADGTDYQVMPGSTASLQDVGGLIGLNAPQRALLGKFLQTCGIDGSAVDPLIDALEDYTDGDDLVRTQGAEREAYEAKSLAPPRNAPLLSVGELWGVMRWADVRPLLEASHCDRAFTVEESAARYPNPATSPPTVLRAQGVTDDLIQAAAQEGRDDPVELQATTQRLRAFTGPEAGLSGTSYVVQRTVRVVHRQADNGPWRLQYTLRLTPDVEGRPWQIVEPSTRAVTPDTSTASPSPTSSAAEPRSPPRVLPWPDSPPAKQIYNVKKLLSF
ncbi:type II secretion system protein GspK [Variovorax sp. J22P271]|uniref:type II secretion system protein GspK n=1 Tax=Variovorax davisae TaxID=3053515 RepID=UPI00257781EC|nr:type II secretion system protein GspK [Variovorax sp. J22P271]MDM0033332.1 type II secretion system protein GspK [Variovorax sp. J22P271]